MSPPILVPVARAHRTQQDLVDPTWVNRDDGDQRPMTPDRAMFPDNDVEIQTKVREAVAEGCRTVSRHAETIQMPSQARGSNDQSGTPISLEAALMK